MTFYTVPQLAETLGVNEKKVRGWITSGQLKAVNVSEGEQRPRYRVQQSALDEFCKLREVSKPPKIVRRAKRRTGRKFIK